MFDPIINSKLNRLLEGGGYSEDGKVLTFNGDATGKTVIENNGNALVKISDTPIDLNTVTAVTLDAQKAVADALGASMPMVRTKDGTWTIDNNELFIDGAVMVMCVTDANADAEVGTYILAERFNGFDGFGMWISRIETTETIHPIDPKYLPGVCLPVVELSEETVNSAASAGGALVDMTADEVAFFVKAVADQTPCLAKASMNGISVAAISNLCYGTTSGNFYRFEIGVGYFSVIVSGDTAQILYANN